MSACYSLHVVLKSYLSPTVDYSLYDCLSNKHAKLQLYSTSMLVQLLFDLLDGTIYVLLVVQFGVAPSHDPMHDGSQLVLDREAEAAILPQARDSNSDECVRQSVQRDDGPVP